MSPSLQFVGFIAASIAALIALLALRTRSHRGPFIMLFTAFWFMSFLTGNLGYKVDVPGIIPFEIRYSSSIFVLIFAALLLVYICEGTLPTRNMIYVSIGSQAVIALAQIFFHGPAIGLLSEENRSAAELIFKPSYLRMGVSLFATVVDLYFAVAFFQFLINRAGKLPLALLIFVSLSSTMALDSVIFLGGTRPDKFLDILPSHIFFKTAISAFVSLPMALFVRWFQKHGHVDLNRGSMDIFRRIETLEEDLEKANTELRRYASSLEQMVEERTKVIREKQAPMDFELTVAAEVQRALLPSTTKLGGIPAAAAYVPASGVSGDLYDFALFREDEVFFFIADISGHGVPGALVGSMCAMSLSRISLADYDPGTILSRISDEIEGLSGSQYLTAALLKINTRTREIQYASGGHVPPILIGPSAKTLILEPTGSLIGVDRGAEFGVTKIVYKPGTRLFLYTDCVTEHRNAERDEFGRDKLVERLTALRAEAPQDVVNRIVGEVRAFGGDKPFTDDLTIIVADLA